MPLELKEQLDLIINHLTALKKEQLSQSRQITAMDKRLSNQRTILAIYSLLTSGIVAAIISKFF